MNLLLLLSSRLKKRNHAMVLDLGNSSPAEHDRTPIEERSKCHESAPFPFLKANTKWLSLWVKPHKRTRPSDERVA